jgi:hypothetical protein
MDSRDKKRIHKHRYAMDLLEKLLENRDKYFDRFNRLNSDGMRILRAINRSLNDSKSVSPRITRKTWRNPTFEYLVELYNRLKADEEVR